MSQRFAGFPEEGIDFLKRLKRNNRREWFQPRKEIFERSVKAPMTELVEALNREFVQWAPLYATDPKKAIFRIYRDTRFSNDKSPYKTHAAAVFGKRGIAGHSGGMFYFHVSGEGVLAAGGVHQPEPAMLLTLRQHIADCHNQLHELMRDRKLRKLLGELQGEELSRAPKGFDPDHPAIGLIKKKEWLYETTLPASLAATPRLLTEIVIRFRAVLPLVEFLNRAIDRPAGPKIYPPSDYW